MSNNNIDSKNIAILNEILIMVKDITDYGFKLRLYKPDAHINVLRDGHRWLKSTYKVFLNYQYYYTRMPEHYWEGLEKYELETPELEELERLGKLVRALLNSKEKPLIFKREKKFKEVGR